MENKLKISHFSVDKNLMYLIQQVTKESTAEIISYFNDLAITVLANRDPKKSHMRLDKNLHYTYKCSPVPYRMNVHVSGYMADYCHVKVSFPTSLDAIDISKTIDSLLETTIGLEGSEPLPPFERPRIKIPVELRNTLNRDVEIDPNDLPESLRKFVNKEKN